MAESTFELRDELQALQDIDTYTITHDHDLSSEDPAHLLEGLSPPPNTCYPLNVPQRRRRGRRRVQRRNRRPRCL